MVAAVTAGTIAVQRIGGALGWALPAGTGLSLRVSATGNSRLRRPSAFLVYRSVYNRHHCRQTHKLRIRPRENQWVTNGRESKVRRYGSKIRESFLRFKAVYVWQVLLVEACPAVIDA